MRDYFDVRPEHGGREAMQVAMKDGSTGEANSKTGGTKTKDALPAVRVKLSPPDQKHNEQWAMSQLFVCD